MKIIICIFMILSMTLCVSYKTAPTDLHTTSREESTMSYLNDAEKFQAEVTEKIDDILSRSGDQPVDQLISTVYSEEWLFTNIDIFRRYNPIFSYQQYLEEVDAAAPVECIRKTGEDAAYVVYQTEQGRAYLFFKQEYGRWVLCNGAYVQKHLSLSDFDKIQVSDSVDAVAAVDPAVNAWKEVAVHSDTEQCQSVHLTSDGLVVVEYWMDGDRLLVSGITTSADYKWTDSQWTEDGVTYDYRILSQDSIG